MITLPELETIYEALQNAQTAYAILKADARQGDLPGLDRCENKRRDAADIVRREKNAAYEADRERPL